MNTLLILIFVLTYAAIAFEHPLQINKSATALIGAGLLWTVYALAGPEAKVVDAAISDSLMSTAQIVFFLMGAPIKKNTICAVDISESLMAASTTLASGPARA